MVKRLVRKEEVMAFRLTEGQRKIVERVCTELGLTLSEYIRKLVLEDLERRSIFSFEKVRLGERR